MRHSQRAGLGITQLFVALAVLTGAAFAFYYYVENRSVEGKRLLTLKRLVLVAEALERYMFDCGGALPTQKQGLKALLTKPERPPVPRGWRGPYLEDPGTLHDGWGRLFIYYCPGGGDPTDPSHLRPFDLVSYGADGAEGGNNLARDIKSWDRSTQLP